MSVRTNALRPPGAIRNRVLPAALFALAVATSLWAWWEFALPIAVLRTLPAHADHFVLVYAHMIGGSVMLGVGALNVYVGQSRRWFAWHRPLGYAYLVGGGAGALFGLTLSVLDYHGISGIMLAAGVLALAWLGVAAMAWRAALQRRFDAHRQWMIRSYVLTWSFVGCRAAMRVQWLRALVDAEGAAIVWLSWIVPLLICELAFRRRRA